ncbi:L-threonine 3-dehydrogenase [Dethiobacter alkaliphilus]|uniref:L-threonine 3-dehydrogenase n=1 Tax=Dethiobacter alkaliphilus TaxID=427926 RepID=UPI002227A38A|nr:L-threonine 3-dehydrogenase [Dethiobacter alkaliphilus]MCW3490027.1 L-threonine 3-dehydrogenase [Dethiobacter alkaliphilus]
MKQTMKALVKDKAGPGVVMKDVDIPDLGPHDVLVKVKAASICGTDVHIYNWDGWASARIKPPVIIGHEMSGYIVQTGEAVKYWQEGDYVSLECHQTCGHCYQCRTGQGHICRDYTILGVDFNGCFAEYVRVPEYNLWRNDENVLPEVACLQDPIGNAVMATCAAEITGKKILVTGCGSIGLLTVGVAKALGAAQIYAVDINDYRLKIAEDMGATATINPLRENMVEEVQIKTRGCGVNVVIEASGDERCLQDSLKTVNNGGQVVLLGIYKDRVLLDLANEVIFKGVTITGITGREIFKTWYKTAELLSSYLNVEPVITHKMKMKDYEAAFQLIQTGQCGKIVLYP